MEPGVYRILFYDYVDDILERRAPHRAGHLALVGEYKRDGRVVAGGALGDPVTGAAIVFRVDSDDAVREFVASDPYGRAGLITGWRIVPWNVVT